MSHLQKNLNDVIENLEQYSPHSLMAFCAINGSFTTSAKHKGWLPFEFHADLCTRIQDAYENKQKLIINVPPQHGKTEICAVYFPVWALLRQPQEKLLYITHTTTFSHVFATRAHRLYTQLSNEYITNSDGSWVTAHGGYYKGYSVRGGISGMAASGAIIDDVHKNFEEAYSPVIREKVWRIWVQDIRSRFSDPFFLLVIGTRRHYDDFFSRLLNEYATASDWHHLEYKAIAEDNDILGRKRGVVLCEQLKSLEFIQEIKNADIRDDTNTFETLYQQNAVPMESLRFRQEHFKHYLDERDVPKGTSYFAIDTSYGDTQLSDYFALLYFTATADGSIYFRHVIREIVKSINQEELIINAYKEYKPAEIAIEKAGNGILLLQSLVDKGLPVRELSTGGQSKWFRSEKIVIKYRNGKVFHNGKAGWLSNFEAELLQFPYGRHDDQVDVAAYAGIIAEGAIDYSKRLDAIRRLM